MGQGTVGVSGERSDSHSHGVLTAESTFIGFGTGRANYEQVSEKNQLTRYSLLNPNNVHKREVYHREFMYQASSWTKARRVVVKMERPAGELLFQFTFIVTNMTLQPKNVVCFYYQRGHRENFIKEAKNGFACDKMSSTDFASNAVKLQIAMLAYNINNWFRRLCLPGKTRTSQMETFRNKLVKIAGKLVYSGRYWTWKLCSSCVYRKEFIETLHNVNRIPKFT